MSQRSVHLTLADPEETAQLAARLAARLAPGDVILLSGGIGAGKTHFARALIQARLDVPEDVPSPSYTLVQIYDTQAGEIWHADLYRLDSPESVVELGLTEAFETAICLVEWPDRLGELTPVDALSLTFADSGAETARELTITWSDPHWDGWLAEVAA